MSLALWDPFREMRAFSEEMDRLFNEGLTRRGILPAKGSVVPAIDVSQDDKKVTVEMALAGFDPEDIDISVSDDALTISGKSKREKEVSKKNYYYKEIQSGSFSRSIALPTAIKSNKVKAEFDNGILKVELPKQEPKKIEVVRVKPQLKAAKK